VDDPAQRRIPTPLDFSRQVKCGVGRIRLDTAFDNGLALWVSGDNLWKGAALNALQNAELMVQRRAVATQGDGDGVSGEAGEFRIQVGEFRGGWGRFRAE
jgi:hypothetical protein